MNIRCRPISTFPEEFKSDLDYHLRAPFRAGWSDTMALLERELRMLDAENAVIELDLDESQLRIDGWPYEDARPEYPGVIISFDSKHGPLRYGTDMFITWKDNVRAVALGLEALRKVDRYGIGKRGEQYVGWRQLMSGEATLKERGRAIIEEHGSETAALKATHPDHGGDPDDFAAVQAARA